MVTMDDDKSACVGVGGSPKPLPQKFLVGKGINPC